jgi:hypothetical protein
LEDAMIARATLPFTLRHILDRVGLASIQQRSRPGGGIRPNRLQCLFAALGDWSSGSDLARRSATLSGNGPERLRHFCPDCGENTAHEGFDEFGAGWYAQICRCRRCGRQGMRVWPLAWW